MTKKIVPGCKLQLRNGSCAFLVIVPVIRRPSAEIGVAVMLSVSSSHKERKAVSLQDT
jgi:hypothetical protein